ncbi:MAG: reverse transcriptase domain-containing protein [Candidatus Thiodiazotropha endolucinida]|nr:hypothetical protein [Candidatus Thiodiazotropha taylori]MCW4344433.1 reverse transcriptase domain-containing protein [Candidatus Thiodiazotropha endolucinida]
MSNGHDDISCNLNPNSNFSETNNDLRQRDDLKILSLNVCGLKSKLNCPEFVTLLNDYDIIAVQESKLDDVDRVNIDGYQVFSLNRKALARYRSGGITLIYKNELMPHIKVLNSDSKLILWFTISSQISKSGESILCGIVYIPPYGSKYSHPDPYLEMQNEYDKHRSPSRHILLFGDFNSRTSSACDYVKCDYFICDLQGSQELYDENREILNLFDHYNIPLERKNADSVTNVYGSQLVDFCKYNNIFILNGRYGQDRITPKLTCKDRSTVDYILTSAENFGVISHFEILDYNYLYSDAHCPISLSININATNTKTTHNVHVDKDRKAKLWDDVKKTDFVEKINFEEINEINQALDALSIENIDTGHINRITDRIGKLFYTNAKNTFGTKPPMRPKQHKPWFNQECKIARNVYHSVRKKYNRYKTVYYKKMLKTVSKEYKNKIAKNVKHYKNERVNRLKYLQTSNSKEFWKIINSVDKKNDTLPPLEDLYTYFQTINNNDEAQNKPNSDPVYNVNNPNGDNEELNVPITPAEILSAVKSLKNNKSPGNDDILNEHIKCTINVMLPVYTKLFNLIFNSGIIPESWVLGDILPIYKNKGSKTLPENYRPITLLSCLGKLFTSIINNRLTSYAEKYEVISHSQSGFRKGFSTVDNLYVIQSLIEMMKTNKNKLYCAFIDFKQAFDNVWRNGLWIKLANSEINGKCLTLIQNMYSNIKSRVTTNEGSTAFFPCCKGVRQGENLSPFLFSIYLNDLEHFFMSHGANGVTCEVDEEYLISFAKIFILLFADDTVLFSSSKEDLQYMLDVFENYCDLWKLTVNTTKTKVLIFNTRRYPKDLHFYFKGEKIELVNEYKYLGIFLSKSGKYLNAKKHVAEQANNAMFSLLRKSRSLNLPLSMQIDLFNKMIKPILLYGCEIWAVGNLDIIERVQLKFLKLILNLKKSTPSYMIYGELGIYPLEVDIKTRIISFWTKLLDFNSAKLSTMVYEIHRCLFDNKKCKSPWLENIKQLIEKSGFSNIWAAPYQLNSRWFCQSFKQKLQDMFLQKWDALCNVSSSGLNYRIFKTKFEMNNFISNLTNKECKSLIAFRTRNHKMPVETGRWHSIPLNERLCTLCSSDVGDEYHYLLQCKFFENDRKKYISTYYTKRPNTHKLHELMNVTNVQAQKRLTRFVEIILKTNF